MNVWCSALLALLLGGCASSNPHVEGQALVPVSPIFAPEPVVLPEPVLLPEPVGLPPLVPFILGRQAPVRSAQPQNAPAATRPSQTQDPQPGAGQQPSMEERASHQGPPPVLTLRERPECEPQPVPHRGGHDHHDWCADTFPPNRFPGHDIYIGGKRFDALQVGVNVL